MSSSSDATTRCYDEDLAAYINFDNASEAIVARLALGLGIDGPVLSSVISAMKNPAFNPLDVSFNSSEDFYVQIAQRRQREEAALEYRSQGTNVPDVVVDGIIDTLKSEYHGAIEAMREKDEVFGFSRWRYPLGGVGRETFGILEENLSTTKRHLSSCALVHSSWLAKARRALGSSLISHFGTSAPISRILRNPCFGEWTWQVELEMSSQEPLEPLVALFSRMPNTRRLRLSLMGKRPVGIVLPNTRRPRKTLDRRERDRENGHVIRKALNCLPQLEDLSLVMPNFEPSIFKPHFLSLPVLRSCRLAGLRDSLIICDDEPRDPLMQLVLHVLPSLQSISVAQNAKTESDHTGLEIPYITWRRQKETIRESRPRFVSETIDCIVRSALWQISDEEKRMFSKARNIRVCWKPGCLTADCATTVLEHATAISTISLCAHDSQSPEGYVHALPRISKSVEEIQLIFSPRIDFGGLGYWDLPLSEALSKAPHQHSKLSSLKLVLPQMPAMRQIKFASSPIDSLPLTQDWCTEHGVVFESIRDDCLRACCELY